MAANKDCQELSKFFLVQIVWDRVFDSDRKEIPKLIL